MGLTFDLNANVSMLPMTIFTLEPNQYVSSEANEIHFSGLGGVDVYLLQSKKIH